MSLVLLTTKMRIPKFSKNELLGLEKYDRMVLAIAQCQEVDELMDMRNMLQALEKYSAAAKHFESELRAMDVRIRASRRAGELIAEGQKSGEIATPGDIGRPRKSSAQTSIFPPKEKPKTLGELGISHDQSSQWKELAGIPEKDFEDNSPLARHKRTTEKGVIQKARPKPDPVKLRQQAMADLALKIWGRVRDVPNLAGGEPLNEIVAAMDEQLLGLREAIPKAFRFLTSLNKEIRHGTTRTT